jgi:hypothetical protein
MWKPECHSHNDAIAYVRNGLPLKKSWFCGVGCSAKAALCLMDIADEEDWEDEEDCDL